MEMEHEESRNGGMGGVVEVEHVSIFVQKNASEENMMPR